MSIRDSFTEAEWESLRDAPHLVAMGTAMAGSSGIIGTVSEMIAAAKVISEASAGGSELIKLLATNDEASGARHAMMNIVKQQDPANPQDSIQGAALSTTRTALAAVKAKLPAEFTNYRSWLQSIGQAVAEASKEGGFLGFGGERICDGERSFLSRLEAVL